jgi:hypothetical protein
MADLPDAKQIKTPARGSRALKAASPSPVLAERNLLSGSADESFTRSITASAVHATWGHGGNETPEHRTQRIQATLAALRGFAPTNEVEAMVAAQAVALHAASMECARRSMIAEQPFEAATRLRRDAANMARGALEMIDGLARMRGTAGQQLVRIERVTVSEGGQAVIGAVTGGTGRGGGG